MKKLLLLAAVACTALFTSCDKMGVSHTGDVTGNLYGVWALDTKTVQTTASDGSVTTNEADYTNVHYYLAFSDFPFPHAFVKEGSFTDADLDDVDVDYSKYSYNADEKKISFLSASLVLTTGLKSMSLIGTFDVVELSKNKLVLKQSLFNTATIYSFTKKK